MDTPNAYRVTIGPLHAGQRIDNYLTARLKGVPRPHIYRLLRRGEVRVNRGRVRPTYRLCAGDMVRIPPVRLARADTRARPGETALRRVAESIIMESDELLVLNKPAGIAVHGGSGLSYGVIEALRALRPNAPFLELVHRLDRETSGCLMIAKKPSVLRRLHAALRANRVDKRYLLLVGGRWMGSARRVSQPLRKNQLRSGERLVRADPSGQEAVTHLRPVAIGAIASLLEARIATGRTHQIRVHAASLGHPVAGDAKYGDRALNRELRRFGLSRLFLHAHAIRHRDSETGLVVHAEAPLPADLSDVVEAIGLAWPPRPHESDADARGRDESP